jgi:hypothetical protein
MNAAIRMHATIMHFATCIPDWNSLDSVRRAHSFLAGSALVFFALLVLFDTLAHLSAEDKRKETLLEKIGLCCFAVAVLAEIAAFPYGQRNDALSEKIIVSLSEKAATASAKADAASDKSDAVSNKTDALTTRLDVASSELSDIEYRTLLLGSREKLLTGKRRQKLVDALTPFTGQKIEVRRTGILGTWNTISLGSSPIAEEESELAESLIGVLRDAQWKPPKVVLNSNFNGHGISVQIAHNASPPTIRASKGLVEALGKVPLAVNGPSRLSDDLAKEFGAEALDQDVIFLIVHPKEMPTTKGSKTNAKH